MKKKNKSESDIKKEFQEMLEQEIVPKENVSKILSFKDLFTKKEAKLVNKKPEQTFIIHMEFWNDTTHSFILSTSEPVFRFRKKEYILDHTQSKYNINYKMNELKYHEGYILPYNKAPALGESKDQAEPFLTITPSNVKEFITMKFVEKVINPIDIEKWLKMTFVGMCIVAFLMLINIILSSGLADGVAGAVGG